ncbi:hypothetical protein V3N99_03600 [Dermatophilaceae bacterium Soc4.6]
MVEPAYWRGATGRLVAASMVLDAAWPLVTQRGWIWVSVAVIVAWWPCSASSSGD